MSSQSGHTPDVIARPPLLFVGGLLAGWLLEWLWPLGPSGFAMHAAVGSIGVLMILAAGVIFALAARRFRQAGTNIPTNLPTTALVTKGPYRYSRNPIYIALALLYAGIAVVAGLWWSLPLLVPVLVVLHWGVVLREERYLENRFGDAYRAYKSRTRRYL